MSTIAALAGLFMTAFLAATFLPVNSEVALGAAVLKTDIPVWLLVVVASVGNVLGSCVNWGLGLYLGMFKDRKWFPIKPEELAKAQGTYHKYGRWSLLLSWVPVIGDPLTMIAGVMKEPLRVFIPLVAIAKTARYIAAVMLVQELF